MKLNLPKSFFLLCLVMLTINVLAQDKPKPSAPIAPTAQPKFAPPRRLPDELTAFFVGSWSGAGGFANGKKIEADVSFTPDLDNQWLAYHHTDRAPSTYKSSGLWGFEYSSKRFVMILADNFGGARLFSSDGWTGSKIVFLKSGAIIPEASDLKQPVRQERFTFEKQNNDEFKMTYEFSQDGNIWKLGDYLVFTKKK